MPKRFVLLTTVSSAGCCALAGCNDADHDTRSGCPESQVAVSAANADPDDHVRHDAHEPDLPP